MLLLIVGLILFLGVHSVRLLMPEWRQGVIDSKGESTYKAFYSGLSLVGLIVLIIGYGQTREVPHFIWFPPVAMAHIASLLTLLAFILLAAAYVPGNRIKSAVGHPMVLGVKVWAFSHLLANGRLGDMILFGAFLAWAVMDYVGSRKADRLQGVVYSSKQSIAVDSATVAIGTAAWLVFALWLHLRLIGVSPFGA